MLSVWWAYGWWLLWLIPSSTASDLATCSRKWVKMNDRNYNRAIRHYAECVLLGQALDPPARNKYQANIVMNLKRTCNYFFDRSSLPTSNLVGVVREVARILEGFDEDTISQPKSLSWNGQRTQCSTQIPLRVDMFLDKQTVETTCDPIKTKIISTRKIVPSITIWPLGGYKQAPPGDLNSPPDDNTNQQYANNNQQDECLNPLQITEKNRKSSRYLIWLLCLLLLLLLAQTIFLIWFCCFNNCMCLKLCKSEARCVCDNEYSRDDLAGTDAYYMHEIQHDLASLSSDNVGSDSEFEALLKMNKLPKAKRQLHSKEVD